MKEQMSYPYLAAEGPGSLRTRGLCHFSHIEVCWSRPGLGLNDSLVSLGHDAEFLEAALCLDEFDGVFEGAGARLDQLHHGVARL